MSNEIGEAKRGLAAVLSSIDGLRVFDHAPDSVHEFPAAIVRLESRESVETLGGGRGQGQHCAWKCWFRRRNARQAEAMLDALVEPQGARSIEAAANTDPSWDGAVDYGTPVERGQHRQSEDTRRELRGRGFSVCLYGAGVGVIMPASWE